MAATLPYPENCGRPDENKTAGGPRAGGLPGRGVTLWQEMAARSRSTPQRRLPSGEKNWPDKRNATVPESMVTAGWAGSQGMKWPSLGNPAANTYFPSGVNRPCAFLGGKLGPNVANTSSLASAAPDVASR